MMSLCVMHKGLQEASTCIDPAVRDKVLQEYAFLQLAAAQVFASHDSFCFVIVLSGLCVKFKSSDICQVSFLHVTVSLIQRGIL